MDRTNDYLIQIKPTGLGIDRNGVHLLYFTLNTILTPFFYLPSRKHEMFCVNPFYLSTVLHLLYFSNTFLLLFLIPTLSSVPFPYTVTSSTKVGVCSLKEMQLDKVNIMYVLKCTNMLLYNLFLILQGSHLTICF